MNLREIYECAFRKGIELDPRGETGVEQADAVSALDRSHPIKGVMADHPRLQLVARISLANGIDTLISVISPV